MVTVMAPPESAVKPWKPGPQKRYVLRGANVVDTMSGSVRRNCTVKLAGGKIASITDGDEDDVAEDATIIDVTGKYLCPGLIDSHVHLCAVTGEKDLGKLFNLDSTMAAMRVPYTCLQMLRRGFTTIRDCGGCPLALKEAVEDMVLQGPRIFRAGLAISQTGGHADLRGPYDHTQCCGGTISALGRVCDGVPECIRGTREELRTGADFIKIMGGGGVASPTDKLENIQFTPEEVRAITTVARNNGTYVTAHAYTPQAIRQAVDNGVMGIEHGNLIDPETAKYMAAKGVYLTPTLITYSAMNSPEFKSFLPPESAEKNVQVLDAGVKSLKMAFDAGVNICFGTDLLGPMGILQTHEFALRSQVLSADALLKSATVTPAKMMKQEEKLGQIAPGFVADILILNANPLENIKIFDAPDEHLLAVLKEGRVHVSRWSKLPEDVLKRQSFIE
ncbi:amidohydrolase [Xylona heveae TC161]|uniref:Amidohydrolase n=1 Tax=Xylona heveae (strain CBS 132557 / TC161) TaxID=1328760 RepID=A0A165AD66_XYLHT|nr:amidohydrolase [Xylona heveae TC161]KZF20283.1 amidohydrolase [Xylona heveae TC161]